MNKGGFSNENEAVPLPQTGRHRKPRQLRSAGEGLAGACFSGGFPAFIPPSAASGWIHSTPFHPLLEQA